MIETVTTANRKIAFVMKLYTWNIPEISHFLEYDRYMSWIFHTYDTIQNAAPACGHRSGPVLGRARPPRGNKESKLLSSLAGWPCRRRGRSVFRWSGGPASCPAMSMYRHKKAAFRAGICPTGRKKSGHLSKPTFQFSRLAGPPPRASDFLLAAGGPTARTAAPAVHVTLYR